MKTPLTLHFHGPDWVAQLRCDNVQVYVSKSCATQEQARSLAKRWAKKYGHTIAAEVTP
jgi:hypothetical protein